MFYIYIYVYIYIAYLLMLIQHYNVLLNLRKRIIGYLPNFEVFETIAPSNFASYLTPAFIFFFVLSLTSKRLILERI